MYRVKSKWERGMSQSELVLVDAIATSTEATRELWRYLFGVDLIAKVSLWNFDPATPLFLMVQATPAGFSSSSATGSGCGSWMSARRCGGARTRATTRSCSRSRTTSVRGTRVATARARTRGRRRTPRSFGSSAADLASAYLGAFSFERLAAAGRVEELADGAIARATALFRTRAAAVLPRTVLPLF